MIHFSFMTGFNWCTTASLVRSTNTIFQSPADAQFADCITCLTTQRILLWFSQTIAFSPFHTCLSSTISEYVSSLCSVILPSCHHSVLPQAQQRNTPTHFQSPQLPGWRTIYCLKDLPHLTDIFVLDSTDNFIFASLFTFEFKYV